MPQDQTLPAKSEAPARAEVKPPEETKPNTDQSVYIADKDMVKTYPREMSNDQIDYDIQTTIRGKSPEEYFFQFLPMKELTDQWRRIDGREALKESYDATLPGQVSKVNPALKSFFVMNPGDIGKAAEVISPFTPGDVTQTYKSWLQAWRESPLGSRATAWSDKALTESATMRVAMGVPEADPLVSGPSGFSASIGGGVPYDLPYDPTKVMPWFIAEFIPDQLLQFGTDPNNWFMAEGIKLLQGPLMHMFMNQLTPQVQGTLQRHIFQEELANWKAAKTLGVRFNAKVSEIIKARNQALDTLNLAMGQNSEEAAKIIKAYETLMKSRARVMEKLTMKYLKRNREFVEKAPKLLGNEKGSAMIPFTEGDLVKMGKDIGQVVKVAGNIAAVNVAGQVIEVPVKSLKRFSKPKTAPELKEKSDVPGNIGKHLTKAEVGEKPNKRLVENIREELKNLPPLDEFIAASKAGAVKKGWTKRAAHVIREIAGEDSDVFADLVAATSLQQQVAPNWKMAIELFKKWKDAGKPTDIYHLKPIIDSVPGAKMPARAANIFRAFNRQPLSGIKISSWGNALKGDSQAVTSDLWIGRFAGYKEGAPISKAQHMALHIQIRKSAEALGFNPNEAEETLWSFVKYAYQQGKIEKALINEEYLKSISGENVKNVAEYATLLNDPQIQDALKQINITQEKIHEIIAENNRSLESAAAGAAENPPDFGVLKRSAERLQRNAKRYSRNKRESVVTPSQAKDFHEAIAKFNEESKYKGFVTVYPPEEYAKMQTFLNPSKTAGYAITPDNEIASVFNGSGVPGVGAKMLKEAVENGGSHLYAFDRYLVDYYKKNGFTEVERFKFDDSQAPAGWNYDENGRPDVVHLEYKGAANDQQVEAGKAGSEGLQQGDLSATVGTSPEAGIGSGNSAGNRPADTGVGPAAQPERVISEEAYQAAQEVLKNSAGKLRSFPSIDPEETKAILTIGAYHIENGIRDFVAWTAKMREKFPGLSDGDAKKAWDEIHSTYGGRFLAHQQEKTPAVNPEHLNISDDAKLNLINATDEARAQIENQTGKPLTHEEVLQAAKEAEVLKQGVSREATLAFEASLLKTRQHLAALAQQNELTPEFLDALRVTANIGTDIARSLESFKIDAVPEYAATKIKIIKDLIKLGKTTDEILQAAKGVDFTKEKSVAEFYRQFVKPTVPELLDEFVYQNILSSPLTHIVNTFSNIIQLAGLNPLTKMASGAIDAVASGLTGKDRQHYLSEVPNFYKGALNAAPQAFSAAAEVMRGEKNLERPDVKHLPTMSPLVEWANLKIGKYFIRALEASDVFFRTLIRSGEVEALSANLGHAPNEKEMEAILKKAGERADYYVFRKRPDAENKTGQGNLLSALDNLTNAVYRLRSVPGFKWFIRFVQTPMNILKQGLEYSPAGVFTFPGAADKTEQAGKAAIGSLAFGAAAWLAASGRTTWSAPSGAKEKNEFYAAGMQPYSIKIGDKWYSYSKIGPLAYPVAMAAALHYFSKESPNALSDTEMDKFVDGMTGILKFFSDQSYMQGLGDLVKFSEGEKSKAISSIPSQLVPLSSLQGWVNNVLDPLQRKAEGGLSLQAVIDQIQMKIIGMSKYVPAQIDNEGRQVKKQMPVVNALSPVKVSKPNPAQVAEYKDKVRTKQEVNKMRKEMGA